MTLGSVYFDRQFKFQDGKIGEKLFILLNDGSVGFYIVVLLTSKQHRKGKRSGCQPSDFPLNFFIPKGMCELSKDSWVLLDNFYAYDSNFNEMYALKKSGRLSLSCNLPESLIKQLLNCAKNSLDLEIKWEEIIDNELNKFVL